MTLTARNSLRFPSAKETRSRAEGRRFEAKVQDALRPLGKVLCNPWFEFADEQGLGRAQPDAVVLADGLVGIIECKRTFRPEAVKQLEDLYLPLARHYWSNAPVKGIIVCRHLSPNDLNLQPTLEAALLTTPLDSISIVDWRK